MTTGRSPNADSFPIRLPGPERNVTSDGSTGIYLFGEHYVVLTAPLCGRVRIATYWSRRERRLLPGNGGNARRFLPDELETLILRQRDRPAIALTLLLAWWVLQVGCHKILDGRLIATKTHVCSV